MECTDTCLYAREHAGINTVRAFRNAVLGA